MFKEFLDIRKEEVVLHKLFSVVDIAASVFLAPFCVRHEAEARRSLAQSVNDPRSTIAQYPEQFQLVEIGTFDDSTGHIECFSPIRPCCMASELVKTRDASPHSGST